MKIQIVNKSSNPLPTYSTEYSAGMDLRANLKDEEGNDEVISIAPGERVLIPTGLYLEIPYGYEGQIRPRSGLAIKYGITVLNTPGTIDADYRNEIGVILINYSSNNVVIEDGRGGEIKPTEYYNYIPKDRNQWGKSDTLGKILDRIENKLREKGYLYE